MNSVELAKNIRLTALEMVHRAKSSHIGGALSMADILAVLYADGGVLKHDPGNPAWEERDRFILSKGHACTALYAALAHRGFFPLEKCAEYGRDYSDLMCHISHKVPGVEFSTGSLGHGLPFATGRALAAKRQEKSWRCLALLSDGELDEGSNWEAFLFAPHHRLDNLTVIIDCNGIQSLGDTREVLDIEPLAEKFRAFRWAVREVDGHDHDALRAALSGGPWEPGKPSVLIPRTTKGKGAPFMENLLLWHYKSPSDQDLEQARQALS